MRNCIAWGLDCHTWTKVAKNPLGQHLSQSFTTICFVQHQHKWSCFTNFTTGFHPFFKCFLCICHQNGAQEEHILLWIGSFVQWLHHQRFDITNLSSSKNADLKKTEWVQTSASHSGWSFGCIKICPLANVQWTSHLVGGLVRPRWASHIEWHLKAVDRRKICFCLRRLSRCVTCMIRVFLDGFLGHELCIFECKLSVWIRFELRKQCVTVDVTTSRAPSSSFASCPSAFSVFSQDWEVGSHCLSSNTCLMEKKGSVVAIYFCLEAFSWCFVFWHPQWVPKCWDTTENWKIRVLLTQKFQFF